MAESEAQAVGFQIDHYFPQAGRLAGTDQVTAYENLMWACQPCNREKSDFEPTCQEWEANLRLLKIDCDAPADHLAVVGEELQGLSPIGWLTIDILLLNDRISLKLLRQLRRQLWAADAIIRDGLRALAGVRLDALPPGLRGKLLSQVQKLDRLAQAQDALADEIITAHLRSPYLDADPALRKTVRKRRQSGRRMAGLR